MGWEITSGTGESERSTSKRSASAATSAKLDSALGALREEVEMAGDPNVATSAALPSLPPFDFELPLPSTLPFFNFGHSLLAIDVEDAEVEAETLVRTACAYIGGCAVCLTGRGGWNFIGEKHKGMPQFPFGIFPPPSRIPPFPGR